MAPYLFNVLVALDQLGNALCRGMPDETISARAFRAGWKRRERAINWLFKDPYHCRNAYLSELRRSQLPSGYRTGAQQ